MPEWQDLGDDELAARLLHRDIEPSMVKVMVEDRDCCPGCIALITEALDE